MSTTGTPSLTVAHAARPAVRRPDLGRLVGVELRKAVDTRAGRWLTAVTAAIGVIVALVGGLTSPDTPRDLGDVLGNALIGGSILLPVVAILSITSEWSQRTALATFTLVPDRWRVVRAKVAAAGILGVATFALVVVASVVATVLRDATGGAGAELSLPVAHVGEGLLFLLANMGIAVAFALAVRTSAPAIVAYFVLPSIVTLATQTIGGLDAAGAWLDTTRTLGALSDGGATATEWLRIAVSLLPWLALPAAVGLVRLRRSELA